MSNDEPSEEDIEILRAKMRTGAYAAERRTKETRIPTYASRRKSGSVQRTEQTNLKFTKETKRRLLALSAATGESMVEYIEKAIEIRAKHDGMAVQ